MSDSNYPLMMRKTDYVVMPYTTEAVTKEATHVGITVEQYRYLIKNPEVNGPKLFHFLVTTNAMADADRNAAFMDVLRGEQKKIDDGASVADAPPAEAVLAIPPTVPDPQPPNDPFSEMAKTLEAIKDKKDLVAYVTKTLGLVVDERCGKAKIIENAIADLRKASQEVG